MKKSKGGIWERLIPLSKAKRYWDIDFWQSQKPEVPFRATWSLVVDSYKIRGKKINANTLRLQRTIENIERFMFCNAILTPTLRSSLLKNN